jgi:uncharacterized RDD family membrane protein YckC
MNDAQVELSVHPTEGPGSPATVNERARARLIDCVVLLVIAIPVFGIAGLFGGNSATTDPSGSSDPVSTVATVFMFAIAVAYDPLTTAWFGTTPGKRASGLDVVVEGSTTRAQGWRLAVRSAAEWILLSLCVVPGVLDFVAANSDPRLRTWHDRLAGTLVVRTGRGRTAVTPASRSVTREPWASAVAEARRAQHRFIQSTTSVESGPLRERFAAVARQIDRCVEECLALAGRGEHLAAVAGNIDAPDVAQRAKAAAADAKAHPSDSSRVDLAKALASEAASTARLAELVGVTERTQRRLIAQLNDAVNRAIEVTYSDAPEAGFASLVDELESLRVGFVEARQAAAVTH